MPTKYKPHPRIKVEKESFTLVIERTIADKLRAAAMKKDMSTTAYITTLLIYGMNSEHLI
jgi:hypothetical protein